VRSNRYILYAVCWHVVADLLLSPALTRQFDRALPHRRLVSSESL